MGDQLLFWLAKTLVEIGVWLVVAALAGGLVYWLEKRRGRRP